MLDDLRRIAAECIRCELHKGRINPVFDKDKPTEFCGKTTRLSSVRPAKFACA